MLQFWPYFHSDFLERSGVKAGYKIESAESKVVDSLRDHCTYNPDAQNNPHLYSRVVNLMPELDSLSQLLISRLQQAILDHDITVPTQVSLLFPKQRPSLSLISTNSQAWLKKQHVKGMAYIYFVNITFIQSDGKGRLTNTWSLLC